MISRPKRRTLLRKNWDSSHRTHCQVGRQSYWLLDSAWFGFFPPETRIQLVNSEPIHSSLFHGRKGLLLIGTHTWYLVPKAQIGLVTWTQNLANAPVVTSQEKASGTFTMLLGHDLPGLGSQIEVSRVEMYMNIPA